MSLFLCILLAQSYTETTEKTIFCLGKSARITRSDDHNNS